MKKLVCLFIIIFLVTNKYSEAQVSTNGSSGLALSYTSLANAIIALNSATISSPVIITLSGNETAPVGGYAITQRGGSITNTITIQGSGSIITASSTLVAGSQTDAFFKIIGGDYICIQNFNLQENVANTITSQATNNMTEFGVALFMFSATDGAQNNTIQNNTITLGASYQNAIGIFSTSSSSATNGSMVASSTAGTNSNNKFYTKNISNVAYGMYFICPPVTATVFESNNDIGGLTQATGNNITFGNATSSTLTWTNFSGGTISGIYFLNGGAGNVVCYNTITSKYLLYAQSSIAGIFTGVVTAATGVSYLTKWSYNKITLTYRRNSTSSANGIDFGYGLTTASIEASFNNIKINHSTTTTSTGKYNGINAFYDALNKTINFDTISIVQSPISAGSLTTNFYGIKTGSLCTTENINNNLITLKQNPPTGSASYALSGFNYISFINIIGGNGTTTGSIIAHDNILLSDGTLKCLSSLNGITIGRYATTTIDIRNNIVNMDASDSPTYDANNSTALGIGINGQSTASSYNVISNNISIYANNATVIGINCIESLLRLRTFNSNNITINGKALEIWGIHISYGGFIIGSYGNGNKISIATSCVSPTIYGILADNTSGTSSYDIEYNSFNGISASADSTNAPIISAIEFQIGTNTGNNIIAYNTIKGISTGAGSGNATINAINIVGGIALKIFKNKIYDISTSCSGSSTLISGIKISKGSTEINNNIIGFINSFSGINSADALRGINITSTAASTLHKIYYNTIYMNTSSTGTNFGTSGIFFTGNNATVSDVDLKNNIIVNSSIPKGTGQTIALRINASSLSNYLSTSNNNLFYAGIPGVSNMISNYGQSLSEFQTLFAPRETASFTENPSWLSTNYGDTNFLHIDSNLPTLIESAGTNIAGYTDDIDQDIRQGNTSYFGTGTASDIGADEFEGFRNCVVPSPGNTIANYNSVCSGQDVLLSLQNIIVGLGVTYQWQSSDNGTTYANISGATQPTYSFAFLYNKYYKCSVTCSYNTTTIESNPVFITTPSILNTIDGSRCGSGSVTLNASGSNGSMINWYTSISGYVSVNNGSTFNTPVINTTTTYYVESVGSASPMLKILGSSVTTDQDLAGGTPYSSIAEGSHEQYLIRAAELNALGINASNITNLGFYVVSRGDYIQNNFTIKMANTSINVMPSSYITPTNGFTTVYSIPTLAIPTLGWNSYNFSTPFIWDGVSNVLIDICHDNDPNGTCTNCRGNKSSWVRYTGTNYNSLFGSYGYNIQVCGTTGTLVSSIGYTRRPNMMFGISCISPRVPVVANIFNNPDAQFISDTHGTTVNFTNTSTNAGSCYWDFGDGNSSNAVSPTHSYTSCGMHEVTLVVINSCGNDTIKHSVNTAYLDNRVACNSFTWIDGITYTINNNTATDTLTNHLGNDSIILLNLIIKHSTTGTDVKTACDSYTWIDGITYTTSNNTATYTITNTAGCDSVISLNLTIKHSSTGTDVKSACNSYTWINGVTYTSSNNTASYTLPNSAGCDSIITLNLNINYSTTGTDIETAFNSYTWINGVTYTSNNNTATYTISNAAGCDSVITLNLTIQTDIILHLKLFIEGLYTGGGLMSEAKTVGYVPMWGNGIADKINIELHDTANYNNIIYSASGIDLSTTGTANHSINSPVNSRYYLTIKHRNSIETVSATPVSFSGQDVSYDFSTSASKAFGDNMKFLSGGIFAIYSGEAMQDGVVDGSDMAAIDNSSSMMLSGYYPEDINGDGIVDGSDMAIVDNNANIIVRVLKP